jgi:tripeptidyl-peptidase-1
LSKAQVAQLVKPHPVTLELMNSWLEHHRVLSSSISMTHGGGWLTVTGVLVSQANEMLGASYQVYRPSETNGTTILRTVGYALPTVLHSHVKTVVPTTYFASTRALRRTLRRRAVGVDTSSRQPLSSRGSDDDDDDEDEVDPSELRSLYRTAAYVPAAADRNGLGIAGFFEDYANQEDLTNFMEECRKDALGATFEVVELNGAVNNPRKPGEEASQNIQYSQAIAYPTPQTFYITGGDVSILPDSNLPAADDADQVFLNYLLDEDIVPPQTISISYGNREKNVPLAYADAICDLYARLGARGVTVLVASGNEGVGPRVEGCITDTETGRVQFIIDFPASCMCIALLPLSLGRCMPGRRRHRFLTTFP